MEMWAKSHVCGYRVFDMTIEKKYRAQSSINALIAGWRTSKEIARQYSKDEDGAMTYFAFFLLFMMFLVGGIGVDLMQNEMERTRLQATVDRAVLAAADLDQELAPEAVVADYFQKAGLDSFLSNVNVDQGLNYRIVNATASTTSKTRFMRLVGVDDLPVPAIGTAEERVSNVEISMVLDISGSMGSNNKMDNLQDAAGVFIDTVLRPETANLISINLVPYTAQVNAGETIFGVLNTNQHHNFSYCIDFEEDDFDTTSLSYTETYEHMQHFEAGWNYRNPITNPGCPQQSYEEIMAYSQNNAQLKNRINQYTARANTAIHLGMKWGVAMLDPSFRPITQELGLNGMIDSNFSNRPVNYSNSDTLKTIILMTDGQNVDTVRIHDQYYKDYVPKENAISHWSKYPLYWFLNNHNVGSWDNWRYLKYSSAQADGFLNNICEAAKNNGIVVWSIGFEVTDYSAGVMRDCASTPSHFFRVEGVEISDAFEAIAKQINQLRLTQ